MRVLRTSLYPSMTEDPITMVMRDSDVRDTLESVALQAPREGALVMHDIFTMEDGSIEEATSHAMGRFAHERGREHNMAILFHWAKLHFGRLTTKGVMVMDKPAPLRPEDVEYVFKQLREEPEYRNFNITSYAEDGTMVRLHRGEVHVG